MFTDTARLLGHAGYQHYEISNYARPGRQCRHNLTYWRRQAYLGIGAGAHSFAATEPYGTRWENVRLPAQYMGAVEQRGHAIAATEELSREHAVAEFLFLGLRLLAGVDARRFVALFGATPEAARPVIGRLVEEHLLEYVDSSIRLTPTGLLHADSVFAALM
jgi:oxygen-independent coproporphyrinogen-3 oxidase